jgi:hypothetical protein
MTEVLCSFNVFIAVSVSLSPFFKHVAFNKLSWASFEVSLGRKNTHKTYTYRQRLNETRKTQKDPFCYIKQNLPGEKTISCELNFEERRSKFEDQSLKIFKKRKYSKI